MCGITGFTGKDSALSFLMQGLEKLEYRGYDSSGIALVDQDKITTYKAKGRLSELEALIQKDTCIQTTGIGHTRWATHGIPNQLNAHPHNNDDNTISIVHNGIIENFATLKDELKTKGYHFQSDTDSEVIALKLDEYYQKSHNFEHAFFATIHDLEGSYAVCAVSKYEPNVLLVAKKESPMVIGKTKGNTFCASDATALLTYTKDVLMLEDGQIAKLNGNTITLFDYQGKEIDQNWLHINYGAEAAQKGGYDSFMMKEIHEQPQVIKETLRNRFDKNDHILMSEIDELNIRWDHLERVYFVACGTAFHAGLYVSYIFNAMFDVTSIVIPASEFRYGNPKVDENTLCIFISQSGETADTLAALKLAKGKKATTIAITNVIGSSITRYANTTLYTCAGPEIAVASTKAYTTQVVLMITMLLKLCEKLNCIAMDTHQIIGDLQRLPSVVEKQFIEEENIEELSRLFKDKLDAFFIGRQMDYPTALEGALKLKEISYIHADAYYGGELKHGPIALIEEGSVAVAIATDKNTLEKTLSNIQETISRGAGVIILSNQVITNMDSTHVIQLPEISSLLNGITSIIPLQLLAYYVAKQKGCDIDKPRNLAKSVTVE
ncbi:glutamine--fructose-6-phosphate transaminase (isomerizing) [Solobacterium moorei]|uniref:glutamine--fructose-6-phosphate transaminase (isomerizing) n=1 Tax=Solobacterium moorei TaxID=102148 RepID=UPI000423A9B3|nr:glutamine--fructose-6-phosphate transaminase (isomerizing) [Solobacterium moorei]BET20598.1 glutamine--fructose-6-phosphate transaminase (isomerizing) [Solobacterium moorei]